MAKVGRPKSMTGAEVLECIFQDPDSGDSDIDVRGDGGDDDAVDRPTGSDDDAMSDVEPDERDADASQADTEDTERSDDDIDAGLPPMKVPRVDDNWTWNRCPKKRRIQPRPLSVMKEEQILVDMPDDASPYDFQIVCN